MSTKLEDLGWPEARLFNITHNADTLSFSRLDILGYAEHINFEVVNVAISDIKALKIMLRPFIDNCYAEQFTVADFGELTEDDDVIEGITYQNPFNDIEAEYYYLSADLRAGNISIERTGEILNARTTEQQKVGL